MDTLCIGTKMSFLHRVWQVFPVFWGNQFFINYLPHFQLKWKECFSGTPYKFLSVDLLAFSVN